MRRPGNPLQIGLLALLALAPIEAGARQGAELVDEVLAVVETQPVLVSDVDRIIGLGLAERRPEESEQAFRERVLQQLIDQRLRFLEVDRYGFTELPVEQVEQQVEALAASFPSRQAWRARLEELGLDRAGVERLVARQLLLTTWVEERLGPRVFVSLEDIQEYYRESLVPELEAAGESVPPIVEVREEIRTLLRERRLNQEIERWTAELRRESDVEVFEAGPHRELPPVVAAEE